MNAARSLLKPLTRKWGFMALPPASDVSKLNIPYPPLFQSAKPRAYRYTFSLMLSGGVLVCVLALISGLHFV